MYIEDYIDIHIYIYMQLCDIYIYDIYIYMIYRLVNLNQPHCAIRKKKKTGVGSRTAIPPCR